MLLPDSRLYCTRSTLRTHFNFYLGKKGPLCKCSWNSWIHPICLICSLTHFTLFTQTTQNWIHKINPICPFANLLFRPVYSICPICQSHPDHPDDPIHPDYPDQPEHPDHLPISFSKYALNLQICKLVSRLFVKFILLVNCSQSSVSLRILYTVHTLSVCVWFVVLLWHKYTQTSSAAVATVLLNWNV